MADNYFFPGWIFGSMGVVAIPLSACAILSIFICLERLLFLSRAFYRRSLICKAFKERLSVYELSDEQALCDASKVVLNEFKRGFFRNISLLRIIGAMAPMLGLLGTVLGLVSSFDAISNHEGIVTPSIVASGIKQAMFTTVFGLSISIPAMFFSYLFRSFGTYFFEYLCIESSKSTLSLRN